MQPIYLQKLKRLIAFRTGLKIREKEEGKLLALVQSRMSSHPSNTLEEYYRLLARSEKGPESQEWNTLIHSLVIGESYFFRDPDHFQLFKTCLFPEFIERRKNKRFLRIWSAGCSSGEEPYSIAILLREMILDISRWDIFILATDIDPFLIEKAMAGVYAPWSFRSMPEEIKRKYFSPFQKAWKLDETIRRMVTFKPGNLVKDICPDLVSGAYHMDLIICRNVFIYFEPEAIASVLGKFAKTLAHGGYLITGHTELYGQDMTLFRTKQHSSGFVYQRRETQKIERPKAHEKKIFSIPQSTGEKKKKYDIPMPGLEETSRLLGQADYSSAIRDLNERMSIAPDEETVYLLAQAYANLGSYQKATEYCNRLLEMNPMHIPCHFLMAYMAEEQKEMKKARGCWLKLLYLDPDCIQAYLALSAIYRNMGNLEKASAMKETAKGLLEKIPPERWIEGYDFAGNLLKKLEPT